MKDNGTKDGNFFTDSPIGIFGLAIAAIVIGTIIYAIFF
jgi:hypothetical protein